MESKIEYLTYIQILCNNPTAITPSKLGSPPINSFNPDSNAYVKDPVLDIIFEEHEIRPQIQMNNGFQQIINSQKSPQLQSTIASSKQQPPTFGRPLLFGTQSLIRPQQPTTSLLQGFSFTKFVF